MVDRKHISNSTAPRLLTRPLWIKALCNEQENKLFGILLNALKRFNKKCDSNKRANFGINTQVSLSSFVECQKDDTIFKDYSNLSVDFVIFDRPTTIPLFIIEYFGDGHYPKDKQQSDEVEIRDLKKLIIKDKVGIYFKIICYDELYAENSEKELEDKFYDIFQYLQENFYDENLKIKFTKEK